MADIPSGNYTVALGGTRYAWAGGTLNVSGTSPNQTATYKGQSVTNLNVGTTSVGWDVTINNQGTNYPLSFTGGQLLQFYSNLPQTFRNTSNGQ